MYSPFQMLTVEAAEYLLRAAVRACERAVLVWTIPESGS